MTKKLNYSEMGSLSSIARRPELRARVKCLLVDDLEDNLTALSGILRHSDVELFTARSGPEALDILLKHDMALAILDVQMPEMDGFELAELMRSSLRTRQVPIIFVTAGAHDPVRQFRGYDQGAVDFLYKPLDPQILISKAEIFFEMYRQRQQLADELEMRTQTLRLNEMLMGVLGHDLRNPLNVMLINATILNQCDDKNVRDRAAAIIKSGERMARMIQDLLDVTRARVGGGLQASLKEENLQTIIEGIVNEYRAVNPESTIAFVANGDFRGQWDRDRIAQAVSNLMGNAIQHGQPGGDIAVTINGQSKDFIILAVGNCGEISTELLPSIFDPFAGKGDHAKRSDGLGLGLYIVQQIVQAHRGQINVISQSGYTRFEITLPRSVSA